MKKILIICFILFFNPLGFAQMNITPPSITHNVTVMQNASPSQCSGSWRGQADPQSATFVSGYGMDTGVTQVGVLSCTGCSLNNGNCVCNTCYGNYN